MIATKVAGFGESSAARPARVPASSHVMTVDLGGTAQVSHQPFDSFGCGRGTRERRLGEETVARKAHDLSPHRIADLLRDQRLPSLGCCLYRRRHAAGGRRQDDSGRGIVPVAACAIAVSILATARSRTAVSSAARLGK